MRCLALLVAALVVACEAKVYFPLFSAGDNGGTPCAACTIGVGLIEQLSALDNTTIDHTVATLCNRFPTNLKKLCTTLIDLFGPSKSYAMDRCSPDSHYHLVGRKVHPRCCLPRHWSVHGHVPRIPRPHRGHCSVRHGGAAPVAEAQRAVGSERSSGHLQDSGHQGDLRNHRPLVCSDAYHAPCSMRRAHRAGAATTTLWTTWIMMVSRP